MVDIRDLEKLKKDLAKYLYNASLGPEEGARRALLETLDILRSITDFDNRDGDVGEKNAMSPPRYIYFNYLSDYGKIFFKLYRKDYKGACEEVAIYLEAQPLWQRRICQPPHG